MRKLILLLTAVFIFSCGGGGGSSEGELLVGYFYDSPVENLRYKTSSGVEGKTDSSGKFFYRKGDIIKFYAGNILIGEVTGDFIISPIDLFKGYKNDIRPDDPLILNLVSFFLYLDPDVTDFVITVDEDKLKNVTFNGMLTECIFKDECPQDIKDIISKNINLAGSHFQNSYKSIMDKLSGCYEGNLTVTEKTLETFCNVNNSSIKILIYSDGLIKGNLGDSSISGILSYKDLSIDIPSTFGISSTLEGKIDRNKISGEWGSIGCSGKFFLSKVDDDRCSDIQ
ncbi:MAG TPA: hypothetical protein DEP48_07620 [Persephonella sp.]|uniref:Putative lipoprotein n=1 Tax=Persephonella marina (strain DSM 14350 / EX-H1) TaxID=123214 RepID=C0QU06_PERMH|nr:MULTISPECIES: hypothetical protein [Persephonella]ACO04418.1 putative lipoprotein [Persephonella marina EX-H1]HCB70212.1 hypothetical protein [Persephonella sp.]